MLKINLRKEKEKDKMLVLPKTNDIEKELKRVNINIGFKEIIKKIIIKLLIVIAIATILFVFLVPVFRISSTSMEPTLKEEDVVLAFSKTNITNGDIIAFYYNNKILVKRVIALPYQTVNMDNFGNVYVDRVKIEEKYITDKCLGNIETEFPYKVPANTYFVLGDDRINSIDSRHNEIGVVPSDRIIGEIKIRIWPLKDIGFIK